MLENVQENTYNLITSSRFWMILMVVIIFLCIAIYLYNKYVTPMLEPEFVSNKEFTDKDDEKENVENVEIIIFTVEWCPHSKKAIPIWNEFKETYPDKTYNGYKLVFTEINGEENSEIADKYKVEGYPTIKLLKGNQIIEYDAKPSLPHLQEFLQSTLN
jgi:thiol-disulfide isomerase/thioredoxin